MSGEGAMSGDLVMREFQMEEDADQAAEILRDAAQATPWTAEELNRMGELNGVAAYVSERTTGISGIVIGRTVADEAEILNLAVKRENRRIGEGKKLVQKMLEEFLARGVSRVFLEVRESNNAAIGFYEHLGFRTIGKRKDYYQEPREAALVMELRLGKFTE